MKGKRLSGDGLSLFYAKNSLGNFRVGISVSKKLANAVKRNRLRRRIRACVATALGDVAAGYDLVFVARPGLAGRGYADIFRAVERVLLRAAVISRKPEGVKQ